MHNSVIHKMYYESTRSFLTINHLYYNNHFYRQTKPEYLKMISDLLQVTDKPKWVYEIQSTHGLKMM